MQVTNTKYYNDLPFDDYLAMPWYSFSSIKNDGTPIPVSAGMALGTRVHNYLNEPEKYDWQDVEIVKAMAAELRTYVGTAMQYMKKEMAFTADFTHNGMTLPYKGRVDLLYAGRVLVDWKILAGPLQPAIDRFGYDKQLSGYCLGTATPVGLIIAFNKTKFKKSPASQCIEVKAIKPDPSFWEYQCVRLGLPASSTVNS